MVFIVVRQCAGRFPRNTEVRAWLTYGKGRHQECIQECANPPGRSVAAGYEMETSYIY